MTTRDDDPGTPPPRFRAKSDTGAGPAASALPIGRRPGQSGTRARIVAAARRQFGERGYDRTTIRSVAREAGVDPALVMHFFGTKLRLFGEAVEVPFDPATLVASISAGPPAEQGTRLARFVVGLLKDPVYGKAFTGLVRAAVSDPLAAELLRDRLTRNALVPLARALSVDQPELRAALAATQTLGLVVGYTILKLEALAALPDDELVRLVAPALQRYLAEPL